MIMKKTILVALVCLLLPSLTCTGQTVQTNSNRGDSNYRDNGDSSFDDNLDNQFEPAGDRYLNPGVIANRGGEWVGSDYLLNLPSNIEVYSEIVTVPDLKLDFTERDLDDLIKEKFGSARITPRADFSAQGAPLPLFHLLVMIYPVKDLYVAYVDGRLFESVTVDRAKIDPSAVLQAITWENQSLIMSSKDEFKEELNKTVKNTVDKFIERYKFFDSLERRRY